MDENIGEKLKKDIVKLRYGLNPGDEAKENLLEAESEKIGLLSVSELAKFARVTRSALIFYDHMGLIPPVERGGNNYRYYSPHQVTTTNLVNTLQELDVPLKEIIRLVNHRNPEKIIEVLTEQSAHIDEQIKKLSNAQKLLLTIKGIVEDGLSVDEEKIDVSWNEEEAILAGPQIDYSDGTTIEEAIHDFYKYWSNTDCDLDLNYPVWGTISEKRVKRGDWIGPDKFYFKMPGAPDRKSAGLYATGYGRGYYGQCEAIYKKLMSYIEENGLEICGPSYEMYLLNEISISDPFNYLIKISINVRKANQ